MNKPVRHAPSYFEHFGGLTAQGPVIFGPHLDMPPNDVDGLVDPFRMARRFAHTIARETGEPFVWGWHEHDGVLRPAVCAAELAGRRILIDGSTASRADCPKAG